MITSVAQVDKALYDYAVQVTDRSTWIHNNQNALKPAYPYGVIKNLSYRKVGRHEARQTAVQADDITQSSDNFFELVYTFEFLGDNALQKTMDIISRISLQNNWQILNNAGLGFQSFGNMRDLTSLETDKVISRYEVDITCNVVITAEQTLPFIKTWEYTAIFNR